MKRITNIFFISFLLFLINCKGYSEDIIPYVMTGDFVMDDSSENYSICGVDFYLLNKSDKEIKNINIVFYLFDYDGEPAYECQNKISVEIEKYIGPDEECNFCMSLDRYMNSIPSEELTVDYLYLAKIEYDDGSVWEDPYGLVAFK